MNTSRRRMARAGGAVLVTLVAASMSLGAVAPATADPATDGFWYYDLFHIQAAHDAGYTGKGVTIAVIDSPINLEVPTLQDADIEVLDPVCYDDAGELVPATTTDMANAFHGTGVLSYLVGSGAGYPGQTGVKGIVPDAKIIYTSNGARGEDTDTGLGLICNDEDGLPSREFIVQGIDAAIDGGADIISISLSAGSDPDTELALARAQHEGIVVVASVSNDSLYDETGGFPANANGVVSVQSMNSDVEIQHNEGDTTFDLHRDPYTDIVGPGVGLVWQGDEDQDSWVTQTYQRGTSFATPIVAGFIALVADKYPDATGNQLIQTAIRNTDAEDHPLEYDFEEHLFGYGVASATHMLAVDPTQYEDVNPLIVNEADDPDGYWSPSSSVIADPPTLNEYLVQLGFDPIDEDWENREPVEMPTLDIPVIPIVLGLVGFLVLGGVVTVVIIVIAARKSRPKPTL